MVASSPNISVLDFSIQKRTCASCTISSAPACCTAATTNAPEMTHRPFHFSPLSFILLPITSRPINLSHLGVFPFVTAASIHDGLFRFCFFFKKCVTVKNSQNNGSRCVFWCCCCVWKEGLPVAFSNAGCVSKHTKTQMVTWGDMQHLPFLVWKHYWERNRCTLAEIGKHLKLVAFRLECWLVFQKRG